MEGGPLGNRQKKSIIAFGHQSVNENRCVGTRQFNVLAWMRTNARPIPSNRKRKKQKHKRHFATYKICQKWAKLHFSFPELVFWPLKGHLSDRPLRLIIARSVTKKLHFYIVISTPFFLSRFSAISNFVSSRADLFLDIGKKIRETFFLLRLLRLLPDSIFQFRIFSLSLYLAICGEEAFGTLPEPSISRILVSKTGKRMDGTTRMYEHCSPITDQENVDFDTSNKIHEASWSNPVTCLSRQSLCWGGMLKWDCWSGRALAQRKSLILVFK